MLHYMSVNAMKMVRSVLWQRAGESALTMVSAKERHYIRVRS